MLRTAIRFVILLAFCAGLGSHALAAKRVALVIGNSSYAEVERLRNPASDAKAVAESLQRLGFDKVMLKLNLDYTGLRRTFADFSRMADGAETALIYYAGHGIEVDGQNYLIPVDAKLQSPRDVDFEATPLSFAMSALDGARKLRIAILDACRNNPFRSRMARSSSKRSVGRGFARVATGANTLVAYAARDGTTADDGDGKHSPYAAALLSHLETPGLEIGFLFRRVRDTVISVTGGRQEPFVYGSLSGKAYYLKPAVPGRKDTDPSSQPRTSLAAQAWATIHMSTSAAVLEAFIIEYPTGIYANLAKARLGELTHLQDNEVGGAPDAPSKAVGRPFDGRWKVSLSSVSGCLNNKARSFQVNVSDGKIDEPNQPLPKTGHITDTGEFVVKVEDKMGRSRGVQKGTITGDFGRGQFRGRKTSCHAVVTLERLK